ncbi:MAG TPA: SUF system NifU family Fe-S cluster assembly protein [Anaerolineae bacterium]|nr:SUF system NifU family Fe-S cluster assembly protein [Anaerolineae bacterium]
MQDLSMENILDHYENPRNRGTLEHPDMSHEEDNPVCGDHIRIDLKVDDGVVTDIRFSGKGCSISQAAASMLTEEVKGKPLDEVKHFDKQTVLDLLGIPIGPVRMKCALLSLKVLKAGAYGINGWPGEDEEDE